MAIPKKGSRLITVDGTIFRWRVRRKPTYCQGNSRGPMTFAVEVADVSGRALLVGGSAASGNAYELALTDEDLTELMNGQPPAYDVSFMRR
ncbi:hypothetical protein [Nonomuraea sp. NPDC049158]|uniref:hypothetical protein n=1 Tax=Nonomuraea sp. NPDC049158 TaxID=3155649 RepID=UPI003410DD16